MDKKRKKPQGSKSGSNQLKGIKSKVQKRADNHPVISEKIIDKVAKFKKKNPTGNFSISLTSEKALVDFDKIIRVGTNFFFIDNNDKLVRTNSQCIDADFGRYSSQKVKKYFGFMNVPEHINYREDIKGYRNLYKALNHKPAEGDWSTIEKILKHLFRGNHYEMILTYLYVMYVMPKHPLPFIGLVSKGKNTGKTTFLTLIKNIFGDNAKVIDPEDVSANFNSGYIDKLVILIDESIEGKNRKKDLQKFKKLITGGVQTRKAKFQDDVDVNFYGKFIMASNDVETVLSIEEENTRFWIIEVVELEDEIFNINEKAEQEIPAFLYYLANEYKDKAIKKSSRLWLDIDDIQTDRVRILQENSRSGLAKEMIEQLTDYFVENEEKTAVNFTATHFIHAFGRNNESIKYCSQVLRDEFGKISKQLRSDNPFYELTPINKRFSNNEDKQRRFYTFTRDEVRILNPQSNLKRAVDSMDDIDKEDDYLDLPF